MYTTKKFISASATALLALSMAGGVVAPANAVASSSSATTAANASQEKATSESNLEESVQEDGETRIEYRSEADRLAFEKFGQYIQVSDSGKLEANIPDNLRQQDKDSASRIDEFVNIVNNPQVGTSRSGNETKIDKSGPITKVYLSHDVVSKVSKTIGAGGGVAGVTAVLASEAIAGPAGWVAAGLTALAAAGNLCDWNDKGIIIWNVPLVANMCTPQS